MIDLKTYQSPDEVTWCPGCGDFGILAAIKQALAMLELRPHEVLLTSGIGCGSKLPHYVNVNSYDALHGRPVPVALGAKLGNHQLKVIAVHGDGDGYGIGVGHLVHSARRNADIVDIVENNQVYGLTKGQFSPTSDYGMVTTTSPDGTVEVAINPIALGLANGATFIARGFSGEPKYLARLIAQAIEHRGYALVDVLQPCVIYNKINTYDWFRERIYKVEEDGNYAPADRNAAWLKAQEWGDRIPV
ncbi:MAG: 2-oxoacid:ferredoxin oxidoreductase subunit beta, partial [Chloroflexi bacterium]|nr:2-oxoacid:ferredoxin oxidoreductase subunit beta [Chloroflexota bacterium]